MSLAATNNQGASTRGLYEKLEDRILARDQIGASECYYDLVLDGRPLAEMLREAVRIHGPYTHVPYHERIDDGFVNFVNNDHCLLSARATLHLSKWLPAEMAGLPMAQTIWYIPTGLDIWNQKINKAPGHYARGMAPQQGAPPKPVVHWPDQEPEHLDGSLRDRLDHWLTLVHRGRVLDAYRVFLGLMQNEAERKTVLAELAFAGLIDLQDRAFLNRSYTTGHKSYRARATVELGTAIGWHDAHCVLYAGALDIAVGPRWYSTYEMACNCMTHYLEQQKISAVPYAGTTAKELALLANSEPLTTAEAEAFLEIVLRQHEPVYLEQLSRLLLAGKGPRQILDVLQIGAAQVLLETQESLNFSISQHCYEYCNTLGWFYDTFEHPQRLKLLYAAASFLNRSAWHQKNIGEGNTYLAEPAGRRRAHEWAPAAGADHGGHCRARRAAGRRLDQGVSHQRRRSQNLGATACVDRLPPRQRPAQPRNRSVSARGLREEPWLRPRPLAARLRAAHRRAPEVRRFPRVWPAFWSCHGRCVACLTYVA